LLLNNVMFLPFNVDNYMGGHAVKVITKTWVTVLFLALCIAAPATAGTLEDADAALERGDYAEAARCLLKGAEQGNANAQFNLGILYSNGLGVTKDYSEAARLYRKAADQGNSNAQFNLGILYSNGLGVTQDYSEAAKLYRKSAELGNAKAQFNLGLFYNNGMGVTQDFSEAAKFYRKAAEQGDADAQLILGAMYEEGQGVQKDYVQAHMWYNLAAARFSEADKDFRDNAVKFRDTIAATMTPSQLAEAQRLAREWKPVPAE